MRFSSLLAALLGAAVALRADAEPHVRVLVYEGEGPVRVAPLADGAPARVLEARGGRGLDGGEIRLAAGGGARVDGMPYRGLVRVQGCPAGLCAINEVGLEDYVAATLPGEMYPSWPAAALRAQAVVIRTYALHEMRSHAGDPFDLRAGTSGQVYRGARAEGRTGRLAARATHGEYLAWQGEPILAVYHATSGGRTAGADEVWGRALPYLVSVAVPGEEESPDTYWRARLTRPILERALEALGFRLGAVRAIELAGHTPSGRVRGVRIRGSEGVAELSARHLRSAIGDGILRSTRFEVRPDGEGFVFVGSGRGHGVGMSQWGAKSMADRGAGYREILARFYPGAALRRGPKATAASDGSAR